MKNVDMKVKDGKLVITVDLKERLGKSTSGKSILVASTEGNQAVPGFEAIKFGLNVYTKPEAG